MKFNAKPDSTLRNWTPSQLNRMPAPPRMNSHATNQPDNQPYVEIIEQPSSKSTRFRYECEGRFAGSILGRTATNERKTFPSIKVHNHTGACVVVVSLVTHDDGDKPKPHPHTLVGPECRQGVCTKKVKQNLECIPFPNLGIQCKKKAELKEALTLRQQIRVDPFRTGFEHMEKPQLNNINLMVVRLCFQVFLPDETGKYQRPVPPVCSESIHDKKSAGELSIHSYLPESCSIAGKDEMILLTGKLPKADDLELRFYEGQSNQPDWEGFATFTQKDIHQSVAMTVKIPEYTGRGNRHKQNVMMELRKKSNAQEKSQPRRFFYLLGDSKNRSRSNKRDADDSNSYAHPSKKIKNEGYAGVRACEDGMPTVVENISMETTSSGGSAFNSAGSYQHQQQPGMLQQQQPMYNQQVPTGAPFNMYTNGQHPQQQQPQYQQQQQQQQYQQQQQPQHDQQQFAQMHNVHPQQAHLFQNGQPGPEWMKVRGSDINIYRNDDSGKVFLAPGPTAANPGAPEVELGTDAFDAAELSIDEILKMTRENPESDIYIPSNLSEHINMIYNAIGAMGEEVVQSDSQLDTSSLTRELKDLPQSAS